MAASRSHLLDAWMTATGQTALPMGRSWSNRFIGLCYGLFSFVIIASCGLPTHLSAFLLLLSFVSLVLALCNYVFVLRLREVPIGKAWKSGLASGH